MYVSRDEIRFSILKDGEDYFAHEKETFRIFVDTIVDGLVNEEIKRVFVDASHLNWSSRAKILNAIYAELNYREETILFETDVIWLKTTLKTCLSRNAKRTGRANVPQKAIIEMWNSQTMPKAEEKIDKVYIIEEDIKYIQVAILNSESDENNFIL